MLPRVDLPAPRRPTRQTRPARWVSGVCGQEVQNRLLDAAGGAAIKIRHPHRVRGPGILFADQPFDAVIQCHGHPLQEADGDIALSGLQLRQIARRHTRTVR
jgi:hypothetical protein